jgi:hypothetical protein
VESEHVHVVEPSLVGGIWADNFCDECGAKLTPLEALMVAYRRVTKGGSHPIPK